ncbi:MAG: hypothetical protein QNI87_00760 [Erythrobacter sp.]|uniref:hypothetical protein n=1 Tax=Erythrobacter sp. TaxID=1042 RepID=UPI0026029A53|nr:hypothetical protein [Erythrobacter sp.]MDJ0977047.1 hypothetical protein [Erythrobacter sp.]
MRVHPSIAALRGDNASQRLAAGARAQERSAAMCRVREEWLAQPEVHRVERDLEAYANGAGLEACPLLLKLVMDHTAADEFIETLCARVLAAVERHPLGEAPFRYTAAHGLTTLQLFKSAGTTLNLAAYEPLGNRPAPDSALFADRDAHEIVLRGEAEGIVHTWSGEGAIGSLPMRWTRGNTVRSRARTEARQVLRVERTLLVLQLCRAPANPAPTREVDLATGRTRSLASGDKSASQALMALSVLGALGDESALGVMEETALNRSEDKDVRWEALRQTVSLDTARGMALLDTLAARAVDALARPARALRAQLLSSQPGLRALLEETP